MRATFTHFNGRTIACDVTTHSAPPRPKSRFPARSLSTAASPSSSFPWPPDWPLILKKLKKVSMAELLFHLRKEVRREKLSLIAADRILAKVGL